MRTDAVEKKAREREICCPRFEEGGKRAGEVRTYYNRKFDAIQTCARFNRARRSSRFLLLPMHNYNHYSRSKFRSAAGASLLHGCAVAAFRVARDRPTDEAAAAALLPPPPPPLLANATRTLLKSCVLAGGRASERVSERGADNEGRYTRRARRK